MIARDAESIGFPAHLVGGRKITSSLRPGLVMTLRTERSTLGGQVQFAGSGIRLAPASTVSIPPGKTVRLLVVSTTPQLRLQLLSDYRLADQPTGARSQSALRNALTALGIHQADRAEDVLHALINSHRTLSPDVIRMLSARISRDLPDRLRLRNARVMVEMRDREMDIDGEATHSEEVIPLLVDGRWGFRKRGEHERSGNESHNSQEISSLRAYLVRSTSTPSHWLQLFNHVKNTGDLHWVVIPIGARQGKVKTTGTLRIGIDSNDHSPREATLALGVGDGVWWFSWEIQNDGAHLVSYDAEADAPVVAKSLLARINGRGHTISDTAHHRDGFSGRSSWETKLGVDEYG